jgi:radical SAM protein with 4Fe4S-binding SPASM domain
MVKYAKEKNLEVGFTDNFTIMDQNKSSSLIKAGVDYINVSMDATSKQKFEEIRVGANFEQVLHNIKLFVKTKRELNSSKPILRIHCTISQENIGEIQSLITLAESFGVDGVYLRKHIGFDGISFKKKGVHKRNENFNYSPISLKLDNFPKNKIEVISRDSSNVPAACIATRECFITFDGQVLPCGNLMDIIPREEYSKYQFGDLKHDSLSKVWRSSRYKLFRRQIALGEYPSVCKACIVYRHIKNLQ